LSSSGSTTAEALAVRGSRKEYKTFTLTLINGRKSLNYSEVSAALVNYEVRRQTFSSGSTIAEALAVRDRSSK